jgi:acyl dehydratase
VKLRLTKSIYYEDIEIGAAWESSAYDLTEPDIVAFANAWDPLAIHLDRQTAEASIFKGLTASSAHLLAIKQKLLHQFPITEAVVCTMGFDEVRFLRPARPGDRLRLRLQWLEKRESASKPGHGVATHQLRLMNDKGEDILTHRDTILIRKRG